MWPHLVTSSEKLRSTQSAVRNLAAAAQNPGRFTDQATRARKVIVKAAPILQRPVSDSAIVEVAAHSSCRNVWRSSGDLGWRDLIKT